MSDVFEPRGMNRVQGKQTRTDGWVGGRADTWTGHYQETPASRVEADVPRMTKDKLYAAEVANQIRQADDIVLEPRDTGLSIEPLTPGIGAVIHGIDLAAATDAEIAHIQDVLYARKVVFFRDQGHITRDQQMDFAKRFANIGFAYGRQRKLAETVVTADEQPEILKLYTNEQQPFSASNWHSDVSWSNRPPLGSLLLSRLAPPVGGDTMFADSYAHWDSLNPVLKEFLEGRRAIHGRGGRDEVAHPICRTHPVTGRKALYVNPTFTNYIEGMEPADSARLLSELYAKMYSTPEYCCRYRWYVGSVAMWDNRACQHYAVGDFWPHERRMERVTLVDRAEQDEIPFWEDADGNRHYSELLISEQELGTPVGARTMD